MTPPTRWATPSGPTRTRSRHCVVRRGRALYECAASGLSWNADEIRTFGQRELNRYLAATALEEARNAGLPPVAPAAATAAYIERTAADERAVRGFLASKDLLSVPRRSAPIVAR